MQLAVVFTGKTIGKQLAYTLKPFVFKWKNKFLHSRVTQKVLQEAAKSQQVMPKHVKQAFSAVEATAASMTKELGIDFGGATPAEEAHEIEHQLHLMPTNGMFDDFCDRVVQYGYLVLFAPAFPLAPFLAFVNNVIEIRTSGYKYCRGIQRPRWTASAGIGSWFVVMNILGFLAVLTNASM
eukprot:SAG31_NODE_1196_length_9445_cov_9.153970_3_plen_181_part_00